MERNKFKNNIEWKAIKTTGSNRVNLFSISRNSSHHIATVISGSLSQLERFDDSIAMMEASPKMVGLLNDTLEVLNDFGFIQSPYTQDLERRISSLLSNLSRDGTSRRLK